MNLFPAGTFRRHSRSGDVTDHTTFTCYAIQTPRFREGRASLICGRHLSILHRDSDMCLIMGDRRLWLMNASITEQTPTYARITGTYDGQRAHVVVALDADEAQRLLEDMR